jgi:hypothetical protein
MEVVPARIPLDPAHNRPRLQVAHLEGEAAVTETRPAGRAVIQVSRPVHNWLLARQRERQLELKRQVSFTEIIEALIRDSETVAAP